MDDSLVKLQCAGILNRILNPERNNLYHRIYSRKQKLKKEKDPIKRQKLLNEINELETKRNSIKSQTPKTLGWT